MPEETLTQFTVANRPWNKHLQIQFWRQCNRPQNRLVRKPIWENRALKEEIPTYSKLGCEEPNVEV